MQHQSSLHLSTSKEMFKSRDHKHIFLQSNIAILSLKKNDFLNCKYQMCLLQNIWKIQTKKKSEIISNNISNIMSWMLCYATQIPILGQNNLSSKILEMLWLLAFSSLWEFPQLIRDTLKSQLVFRASLHIMTDCYVVIKIPLCLHFIPLLKTASRSHPHGVI